MIDDITIDNRRTVSFAPKTSRSFSSSKVMLFVLHYGTVTQWNLTRKLHRSINSFSWAFCRRIALKGPGSNHRPSYTRAVSCGGALDLTVINAPFETSVGVTRLGQSSSINNKIWFCILNVVFTCSASEQNSFQLGGWNCWNYHHHQYSHNH